MLYPDLREESPEPKFPLEADLFSCEKGAGAGVVALVSKMFSVPDTELPGKKKAPLTADEMRKRAKEARETAGQTNNGSASLTDALEKLEVKDRSASATPAPSEPASGAPEENARENETDGDADGDGETILGFARIYSGTIRVGMTISCVLPKYNNALPADHVRNTPHVVRAPVEALYTMMGRELVPVESVSAGNVFAIRGLEGKVWRNATLCAPPGKTTTTEDEKPPQGEIKNYLINLGGFARVVSAPRHASYERLLSILSLIIGCAHRTSCTRT